MLLESLHSPRICELEVNDSVFGISQESTDGWGKAHVVVVVDRTKGMKIDRYDPGGFVRNLEAFLVTLADAELLPLRVPAEDKVFGSYRLVQFTTRSIGFNWYGPGLDLLRDELLSSLISKGRPPML